MTDTNVFYRCPPSCEKDQAHRECERCGERTIMCGITCCHDHKCGEEYCINTSGVRSSWCPHRRHDLRAYLFVQTTPSAYSPVERCAVPSCTRTRLYSSSLYSTCCEEHTCTVANCTTIKACVSPNYSHSQQGLSAQDPSTTRFSIYNRHFCLLHACSVRNEEERHEIANSERDKFAELIRSSQKDLHLCLLRTLEEEERQKRDNTTMREKTESNELVEGHRCAIQVDEITRRLFEPGFGATSHIGEESSLRSFIAQIREIVARREKPLQEEILRLKDRLSKARKLVSE